MKVWRNNKLKVKWQHSRKGFPERTHLHQSTAGQMLGLEVI